MSGYELANVDVDVEAGTTVELTDQQQNVNSEAKEEVEKKIMKVGSTGSLAGAERRSLMMKESTHLIGHDIAWSDLNFDVGSKRILDNCYGKVMAGQVCAIMGPSGAGKSSLLNVLAGRSATSKDVKITGTVTVAGKKVDPVQFRKRIAYVMQDDALMATATPREALAFSARLRLPPTTTKQEIEDLVTNTLDQLGITSCADVMIGGELIKGISGGQRKRTSIGIEIITDPALLFLDEPTSGLDSFSAQNCVELFSVISKRNVPVLCTIHQPSSEIFFLFDVVIFMKEGRIFYQGPVSKLNDFFSKFDYNCPINYNPADYVMLLSQTESMEVVTKKGIFLANEEHAQLIKTDIETTKESKLKFPSMNKAPFSRQLRQLMYREAIGITRDKVALIARTGITVFLNLLFGLIFLNAGGGDNANYDSFSAHYGAVTLVIISSMFGQAQPVMLAFPFERPMFLREHSTGTYTGVAYFISKSALEFPMTFIFTLLQFVIAFFMINMQGNFWYIVLAAFGLGCASASAGVLLGCIVPDVKSVSEFGPLLFVPQLLFSGFFIRTSLIPVFLRWAQYLCALKYALDIVLLTEFNTNLPSCQGDAYNNCKGVLTNNNIEQGLWWLYMILLIALTVVFRSLATYVLVQKSKKFY